MAKVPAVQADGSGVRLNGRHDSQRGRCAMIMASEPVVVAPWTRDPAPGYHDEVWSAWLHGSVAAIHNSGRLLLVVPVAVLTPPAIALAMQNRWRSDIRRVADH